MADRRHRRKTHEIRGGNGKYQLRNGLSILPSLFTIGNIFCAYYSVMSTLNLKYDQAAIAIGVGYILDGLDGRVARLTGTSTEFGAQLDSLADVLTFGIAPAILAFSWGIEWMGGNHGLLPGGTGLESARAACTIRRMGHDLCVRDMRRPPTGSIQCAGAETHRRDFEAVLCRVAYSCRRGAYCFDCAFLEDADRHGRTVSVVVPSYWLHGVPDDQHGAISKLQRARNLFASAPCRPGGDGDDDRFDF